MAEQKPGRAPSWGERGARVGDVVGDVAKRLLDALFYPAEDRFSRVVGWAWLIGLLLFGLYLWGIFYSWGNISLDFLDWAEVTGPRYALLKDALTKGQIPLHAANLTALRGVTDRYFAIPDTPFSPEVILLLFMGIGQYLFVDTLIW